MSILSRAINKCVRFLSNVIFNKEVSAQSYMLVSKQKEIALAIRKIIQQMNESIQYSDSASQILLQLKYHTLKVSEKTLPGISQVGFKVFSQTDEDGILLYIFSLIGFTNKKCVEICAGNGIECNTANLIINHGWHGLLIDGNEDLVKKGIEFYKKNPNTYVYPPTFIHSWITRDNVNDYNGPRFSDSTVRMITERE